MSLYYCGMRRCVRVSSVKVSGLLGRLGGFSARLPVRLRRRHRPRPAVRYSLDLSSVEPVPLLRHAPRLPLHHSILQRRFRSPAEAAILLLDYLLLLPSRRRGSVLDRSRSCLSVCLPDRPFPSRNPAFRCQLRVLSGLPASRIP